MNLLTDIQTLLASLSVPIETGFFTDEAPDTYLVVVPMIDNFDIYADNFPQVDVQEARISIYSKSNYKQLKRQIINIFLSAEYTITGRQFIGYEADTGYYHYNVDVANYYETED